MPFDKVCFDKICILRNRNICCGYLKQVFKLMNKTIFTMFISTYEREIHAMKNKVILSFLESPLHYLTLWLLIETKYHLLVHLKHLVTNSGDPDQTAHRVAV